MSRSPPLSRQEVESKLRTARTKREFDDAVVYLRKPGSFEPEDRQALDVLAQEESQRFVTAEDRARGRGGLSGRAYRFSFRNVKREVG